LRMKFGLPSAADTLNTRIIVMELEVDGEAVVLGGIADSVHEVIELEPARSIRLRGSPCAGAPNSFTEWENVETNSSLFWM